MFPLGHLGIVLLIFAPLAYVLAVRNLEANLAPGVVVALLLTLIPDVDMYTPVFVHRGLTHTLLAAGCIGVVTAVLWCASNRLSLGNRVERTLVGFLVGVLSVGSHLIGDVITPMGLRPFLPLDETGYTLSLVSARNPSANLALFGGGIVVFLASVHLARLRAPAREDAPDEASVDSTVGSDTEFG